MSTISKPSIQILVSKYHIPISHTLNHGFLQKWLTPGMEQQLDDPGAAFCATKEMLKSDDKDIPKGHKSQLEGLLLGDNLSMKVKNNNTGL